MITRVDRIRGLNPASRQDLYPCVIPADNEWLFSVSEFTTDRSGILMVGDLDVKHKTRTERDFDYFR